MMISLLGFGKALGLDLSLAEPVPDVIWYNSRKYKLSLILSPPWKIKDGKTTKKGK